MKKELRDQGGTKETMIWKNPQKKVKLIPRRGHDDEHLWVT